MLKEKTCKACGKTLPIANFYRHKKMKDGFMSDCKACVNKSRKPVKVEVKITDPFAHWQSMKKRYGWDKEER